MTKSIKVESRPISSLKPHPRQNEYFAPASEAEIERLAEDIKVRGLVTPVRILRDGTIVCGHSRVEAAKKLGWLEIGVNVCDDLADDETAALWELVRDNLTRRQLSPLGQTRCLKLLWEKTAPQSGKGSTVKRIAAEIGKDEKTVRRYLNVLRLPQFFQQLFDDEGLHHRDVEKMLRLKPAQLAKIEREVRDGARLKKLLDVAKSARGAKAAKATSSAVPLEQVFKALLKALDDANRSLTVHALTSLSDLTVKQHDTVQRGLGTLRLLLADRQAVQRSQGPMDGQVLGHGVQGNVPGGQHTSSVGN